MDRIVQILQKEYGRLEYAMKLGKSIGKENAPEYKQLETELLETGEAIKILIANDDMGEKQCTIHGVNKSYSAMVWNDMNKIKPINKGLYYCFIPECKRYHEHISEYWFDGNDFRDGDTLFKGKFGGRKITEYITHWLIIEKP